MSAEPDPDVTGEFPAVGMWHTRTERPYLALPAAIELEVPEERVRALLADVPGLHRVLVEAARIARELWGADGQMFLAVTDEADLRMRVPSPNGLGPSLLDEFDQRIVALGERAHSRLIVTTYAP